MKKLYVVSLGCPKNLVDSERAVSLFLRNNYSITFDVNAATSILINTCAFITSAVKESSRVIGEFIKLKKDGKIKEIFVFGCLVSRFKEALIDRYPEVDLFVDVESLDKVELFLKGKVDDCKILSSRNYFYYQSRFLLTSSHVAYLKISDGCDNFCSYCSIPYIRGRFTSRKIKDIVNEAEVLASCGVKELVIVSQDSLRYGIDIYGKYKIIEILEKLENISSIRWIRLMYLYPSLITRELIRHVKHSEKVLGYFDIPIQHASDKILKLMNRRYTLKELRGVFDMIYSEIENASIRINLIVGFPTEDEKDFKKILYFVDSYPINYINIFKYSPQKGTASFNLGKIDKNIVEKRYRILLEKASVKIDELNKKITGKSFYIIADKENFGRSYMDAPDIDGYFVTSTGMKPGLFYKVNVKKCRGRKRYSVILDKSWLS